MGGILYAYELPPQQEIKPLSLEEEKSQKVKGETIGLSDIQRGLAKGVLPISLILDITVNNVFAILTE